MKNRTRKKQLYACCKLPRQFVKDTLRALSEARAGKLKPHEYAPRRTSHKLKDLLAQVPEEFPMEEEGWKEMAPVAVGREFGSSDYERLAQLDALAARATADRKS